MITEPFKDTLSERDKLRLIGVHPDLVRVIKVAHFRNLLPFDFTVTEGLRTLQRQKELYKAGASHTMNSRHLTGHAVDLAAKVGGVVRWDWTLYIKLGNFIKSVAADLATPIEWGGDWLSFRDGPHYQLPWKEYPEDGKVPPTLAQV